MSAKRKFYQTIENCDFFLQLRIIMENIGLIKDSIMKRMSKQEGWILLCHLSAFQFLYTKCLIK